MLHNQRWASVVLSAVELHKKNFTALSTTYKKKKILKKWQYHEPHEKTCGTLKTTENNNHSISISHQNQRFPHYDFAVIMFKTKYLTNKLNYLKLLHWGSSVTCTVLAISTLDPSVVLADFFIYLFISLMSLKYPKQMQDNGKPCLAKLKKAWLITYSKI